MDSALTRRDVGSWHGADVPRLMRNVCFEMKADMPQACRYFRLFRSVHHKFGKI
jgi:hypothetical protein